MTDPNNINDPNNNNAMMEDLDVDMDDDDDIDEEEMHDDDDDDDAVPPPPPEEDAAIARRRAIQAIMRDAGLTEESKRQRIQDLMSGGRTHVAPPQPSILPTSNETNNNTAACVHYERNCSVVAPCCDRAFGCRICHDELSPAGHPPMNRFMVQEVVCKNCSIRQPATYVSSLVVDDEEQ
jgi:hypothetical protein